MGSHGGLIPTAVIESAKNDFRTMARSDTQIIFSAWNTTNLPHNICSAELSSRKPRFSFLPFCFIFAYAPSSIAARAETSCG